MSEQPAEDSAVEAFEPKDRLDPPVVAPDVLATELERFGTELGFARVGFAPAERLDEPAERLEAWRARGYHGPLDYLACGERAAPRALFAGVRSVAVVALAYPGQRLELPTAPNGDEGPLGRVADYARGADYHAVIKNKLRRLAQHAADCTGRRVLARPCVDTAPLLERALGTAAGIGFVAKSSMLLAPGLGTRFLLGELLLDLELAGRAPVLPGCGECTACLDACPTRALVGPYLLDARRCISTWTIESAGPIPRELRAQLGPHVYGCDVCQDVCPFNAGTGRRPSAPELEPRPERARPSLVSLLELGAGDYRRLVRRSALRRSTRDTLARNAAVALGNAADPGTVPALTRAVSSHPSALVRGHAAWALGRLGGSDALRALRAAAEHDPDPAVREEARAAAGQDRAD